MLLFVAIFAQVEGSFQSSNAALRFSGVRSSVPQQKMVVWTRGVEPPPRDNPLLTAANCLITPHISWYSKASRERLMDIAVKNLASYVGGDSANVVN